MEIKYLETIAWPGEPEIPEGTTVLRMVLDEGAGEHNFHAVLYGYGSGEATLRISGAHGLLDETLDNIAKATVWASPRTIGHLIMETIRDQ